jgi:VCBS repeat-containing protein
VHGANDPPSFTSPAATAATEDAAYTYAIGVDDADAPETLVVTATTKPAWLTLIDHGDRTATLSGTPANSDVPSTNDVVLDVFDGTTHVTQSFSITVANTNDPPIAVDDLFELDAAPLPMINGDFNLVTNDSDPDIGDTFGISRVQGSESNVWDYTYTPYSTTEIDGDGTLWYYPNTVAWNRLNRNAVVTDVITYELMDSHGATSNAALRVTIHGANDAPSATADTYSVPPSGTLHATTVLVNDSDLDLVPVADTLTAILVEDSTIAQGTLAFHADGTFDYVKTCTPCAQDHETFTYKVSDGLLDSATVTVTINYNAPPVATADVYTINEDETLTTTGATGVRANDSDADGAADIQHVIVITQPVNGTLTPITSSAFGDEMPVDGAFTYVPNPDFNGVDTFQYKLRDSAGTESSIVTVTITVNPINDVPRFSLKGAPDIEVCGGSGGYWAPGQAVSFDAGGPSDESSQNFAFVVTVDDPSLFGPAVVCHGGATETDPIDCDVSIIGSVHISQYDGSIDFSLAPGASGSTTVHVKILDDGGTANGGVNLSAEQTFVIHVLPAANAPSFTEGPDVYGANDGVVKTFTNWATSISANDPAQTVGFTLTADNPSLFAVQPAIASDGALTFTPAVGAHGTTTVTIIATDNGNALCGSTTSAPRTFTIGTDTNVAPSFLEGTDQNVLQNGGAVTVPDWATSINPGAPEEAAQHLIFTVVATDPSLFTVQPAVSFNGTLTFTPNATAIGTTPVSITLQDDGGTANGGADTSATQTFNITVAKLNHAPDITVSPSSITLPFSATDNPQTFSTFLTINGPGAGDSDPGQTPYTVSVFVTSHDNFALFAAGPALTQVGASNVYELTFTITGNQSGNAVLRVTVNDSGGTALGGTNTATQDVSLTVTPGPNHAPTYAFTANPLGTPAGSTPQTYPGFLTVTSPGLNDRPQEPYTVTIAPVSVPAGLFSSAPTLTQGPADGATEWDLQFTPAVGQTGTATYQVTIKDSGGLAYGGTDTAVTSFDIFVGAPVNHAPSFTLTPNPVSLSNTSTSAQTTVTGFLTVTSPGAGDPVQAPYTPSVTLLWTTNTSLFATTPFFLAQGSPSTATVFDLKLQRAVNQTGSATYLVTLQDSGGTLNGGVNQSTQTVTITLTATASAATPAPGAAKAYSALAYPHLGVRMTNSDLHYRLLDDITGGTPPYTATIVSYIGSLGQQRVTIDDPLTGAFTYQPGLVMYTNNRPVSQGFTYKVCDSLAVCSSNLTFLFNYQNGAVNMTTLRFYDMNAPSIYPGGREPEGTAERPFNASMLPTLSANEGITNPEVIFVVRKGSYTLGPATKTFSRLVGEGGPTLSLASLGISALPAGTVIGPAVPLSTNLADRPVITFSSIGSNVGFVVTPDGGGMFKNLIFTADPAATDNGNIPLRIKSSSAADVYTIDNVEITGGANAIMFTGPATTNLTNSVIETNTTGIAIGDTYWIGGGAKVNVINTSTLNSCTSCRLIGAFGTASSATQLTFAADSPITKTAGAWNSAGLTGTYTFNGAVTVTKSGSEDGLVLDVTGTATIAFNGPVQVTTDKGNPLFVSGTPWITGPAPTATSTITMPNAANSFKMLNTATSGSFLGIRMTSVLIGAAGMNIAGLDLKGTVISLTNTNQGTPGTVTLSGSEVGRTGMPCVSTNAAGPIDRSSLTTSLCTP